ncbi:T9SS type A sorting domain-containing protein [Kordia jejudonensis]|uniref:T9SS type A sorting domain-containing protein n=1 Tax=Kordia jejudonensis TaxID=1348245 RepID=UPI0012DFFC3E|nr:T9SS type A sorting domain-containing protein [Kordia jejudonensis]
MKNTLFLLFLCLSYISSAQEFSVELFFQDAAGNQDSVILGYDDNATDDIDAAFNEVNIITTPYTTGLDVRISDELKARITYPIPLTPTYHTKKQIFRKDCPTDFTIHAIDIVTDHWPVTLTWDNSLFNDACRNGTVFTSISPGGWWDTSSPSDFSSGFWRVQLLNQTQVVFDDNTYYTGASTPNYSYTSDDNRVVSVFWFTFGNESQLLSTEEEKLSNVVVYPNPTSDEVKIDLGTINLEVDTIALLDIHGKRSNVTLDKNNVIQLKQRKSGIYFVKIRFKNGQTLLRKIIKK